MLLLLVPVKLTMEDIVGEIPYKRPPLEYPPPANCLDSFLRSLGLSKPQPLRRPPLTKAVEICNFPEALERVRYALRFNPPSTVLRWGKLVTVCNRSIEPSEFEPDPLRLEVNEEEFKLVCRTIYHRTKLEEVQSVVLMRDMLPKMYDKHSLERGKRVSQKERDKRGVTDECFAYGELDQEKFIEIYFKVSAAYGDWPEKPCFFDLGCGVGNLVYAAAFVGKVPWKTCGGIDQIEGLVERGEKRMPRWERLTGIPSETKKIEFMWEQDNFLDNPDPWMDATFILLHWTAFNSEQLKLAADVMAQCREGCLVVTFTNPIPNSDFEILIKGNIDVSWGPAVYYIQEKLTPRKAVKGRVAGETRVEAQPDDAFDEWG